MWELYDALLAGLPRGGTISRAIPGERWTLVENDLGGSGYAMTTEGDTVPAHFPNGIEGMRIKVAAGAAKSWNLMEAGLGIAAINSFYNTPERMAELGFVNDENYAGMVVRHYAAKGYGRARIREELRRRRVPRELWDAALCEMPEQADTVERLLAAKLRGRAPEGDDLRRACAALIRRGFSWEEVSSAAKRLSHGLELDE